jgi:hypothetical protein
MCRDQDIRRSGSETEIPAPQTRHRVAAVGQVGEGDS